MSEFLFLNQYQTTTMKKIYLLLCIVLCSSGFFAQTLFFTGKLNTDESIVNTAAAIAVSSPDEEHHLSTPNVSKKTTANIYTWVGCNGCSWIDPNNWFPSRDFPAADDSLFFEDGNFENIIDVPNETVGYICVYNGTNVTLHAAVNSTTLAIGNSSGEDLFVDAGSSFNITGSNAYAFNLVSGATALIFGDINFTGGAHQLTATDANGITFYSGATFIAGAGFSGNAFGSGTPNSVVFEGGSYYQQVDGGDPFSLAAPNSVVQFQPGNLFRVLADMPLSISGRTYGDIEIDAAGFSQSLTGTDDLNIDNLTIYQGDWNINLIAGDISIKGNVYVAPGATLGFISAFPNTLTFNGTAAQSITIDGTLNFGLNESLTIDNAAGVNLNSNITMGPSTTLTLTSGILKLDAPATTVTLSAGTTLVGGNSNASFVDGKVKKIGNTDFVFPIGKTGYGYVPIAISSFVVGTVADEFTAGYIRGNAGSLGPVTAGPGLDHVSQCDYWTLGKGSVTPLSVDVTGYWSPANVCNGTYIDNLSSLTIAHFDGAGWNAYAVSPIIAGGSTTTSGSITWPGVTTFSPFALASTTFGQNPLPIIINYFTGAKQNGSHLLNWKVTCNSTPGVSMEMQRSTDGRNYSSIYSINATALRCQQPFDYTDTHPAAGVNYYRLKMTDVHSKASYSNIVSLINADKGFDMMNIAPNPVVNGKFELKISAAQKTNLEIVITDMQGRVMQKQTVNTIAGFNAIPVNVTNLAAGTYQLFGNTAEGRVGVLRFVVQ